MIYLAVYIAVGVLVFGVKNKEVPVEFVKDVLIWPYYAYKWIASLFKKKS